MTSHAWGKQKQLNHGGGSLSIEPLVRGLGRNILWHKILFQSDAFYVYYWLTMANFSCISWWERLGNWTDFIWTSQRNQGNSPQVSMSIYSEPTSITLSSICPGHGWKAGTWFIVMGGTQPANQPMTSHTWGKQLQWYHWGSCFPKRKFEPLVRGSY